MNKRLLLSALLCLSVPVAIAADAPAKDAAKPAANGVVGVPGESYSEERQKNEDAERAKSMKKKRVIPPYSTAGWKLVWGDEFDGDKLNPADWGYEIGFVRNHEPQYYTDRPENVRVENGNLILTARKENYPNASFGVKGSGWRETVKEALYTSASVTTSKKRTFFYGRLEIHAQMPQSKGMWPALWLMGDVMNEDPKGDKYLNWPACGEIDFLELWCKTPGRLTSCLHSSTEPLKNKAPHKAFGGGDIWHQTPYDGFHTYTMDWDKDHIYFYYDGKHYGSADLSKGDWKNGDNPFRHPFFLIINLALGGYGNKPDETSVFPSEVKIDWVRYYQREEGAPAYPLPFTPAAPAKK